MHKLFRPKNYYVKTSMSNYRPAFNGGETSKVRERGKNRGRTSQGQNEPGGERTKGRTSQGRTGKGAKKPDTVDTSMRAEIMCLALVFRADYWLLRMLSERDIEMQKDIYVCFIDYINVR